MTRSATCVWKAAREQFRAPECPLNMSEPQWCDLLFGNLCQVRYISVFFIGYLPLCLNYPCRAAARKTYPNPILPSYVGFVRLARKQSKGFYFVQVIQAIYFSLVLWWNQSSEHVSLTSTHRYLYCFLTLTVSIHSYVIYMADLI